MGLQGLLQGYLYLHLHQLRYRVHPLDIHNYFNWITNLTFNFCGHVMSLCDIIIITYAQSTTYVK
jgi:hypothetical protein